MLFTEFVTLVDTSLGKDTHKGSGIILTKSWNFPLNDTSVLVVCGYGDDPWWSFPKGKKKQNETNLNGARRELFEETGIIVNGKPEKTFLCQKNKYYIFPIDSKIFYTRDFSIPTQEISCVAWKTIDQLKKIKCNSDLKMYVNRLI